MAANLRQSLTALRRAFRAACLEPVNSDRSTIGLDLAAGSIDAAIFAEGCNRSAARAKLAALYREPFLDGLDTSAPEFEHWVTQKRRRLAALAAQMVCTASMSLLPPRDSEAALQLCHQLLAKDTMLEPVYRATMRLCQTRGERVAALKIYAACRKALQDELAVEPDHETETLYRDILTSMSAPPFPAGVATETAPDKPSLAIIPFVNLSGNERLNFLCEGLADDVSTGLGRFRSLFVIDRYSAAAVATATSDTVEIGKRLGAAVLVQGSIQVGAWGLRVTVRLADSVTQTQICNGLFKWIQQARAADPDYPLAQAYPAFAEVVINN